MRLPIALAFVASVALHAADNVPPEGFTALFNGKDFTGWVPVNVPPDTYTVRDGMIIQGRIGLQHHGAEKDGQWTSPPALVQFRNVFIKELKP